MNEPLGLDQKAQKVWRQIAVVAVCSSFLVLSCCGGGLALSGSATAARQQLSTVLLVIGSVALLILIITGIIAFVGMLLEVNRKSRQ
jgi:hypothetical protein